MCTSSFSLAMIALWTVSLPLLPLPFGYVSHFTSMALLSFLPSSTFMLSPSTHVRLLLSQFLYHFQTCLCLYSFGLSYHHEPSFIAHWCLWGSQRKHPPHPGLRLNSFNNLWGPRGAFLPLSIPPVGLISSSLGGLILGSSCPIWPLSIAT